MKVPYFVCTDKYARNYWRRDAHDNIPLTDQDLDISDVSVIASSDEGVTASNVDGCTKTSPTTSYQQMDAADAMLQLAGSVSNDKGPSCTNKENLEPGSLEDVSIVSYQRAAAVPPKDQTHKVLKALCWHDSDQSGRLDLQRRKTGTRISIQGGKRNSPGLRPFFGGLFATEEEREWKAHSEKLDRRISCLEAELRMGKMGWARKVKEMREQQVGDAFRVRQTLVVEFSFQLHFAAGLRLDIQ